MGGGSLIILFINNKLKLPRGKIKQLISNIEVFLYLILPKSILIFILFLGVLKTSILH